MSDQPVVLADATHPARADADYDIDSVRRAGQEGKLDCFAAAVVEKGNDGELEICRHAGADQRSFPGALVVARSRSSPPRWASRSSPRSCPFRGRAARRWAGANRPP